MPEFLPEASDLLDWPDVPEEQRPKSLYVDYRVPSEILETLASRGWDVQDIR